MSRLLAATLALASCSPLPDEMGSHAIARAVPCADLPGAHAVLSRTDKRFLIFGELHGTAEAPALFGDLVCAAVRTGEVVVGLELQQDQQPSLDRYLASDGSHDAREDILRATHWANRDGRASAAMFALVERLRVLRASGLPLSVVAFVPFVTDRSSQTPYEKAMAQRWLSGMTGKPKARFIALVGNVHSMRRARSTFEPAAMHMPPGSLVTFGPAPAGGQAWNCQQDGCGPHSAGSAIVSLPRGISAPPLAVRPAIDEDYWYATGGPFTASAPLGSISTKP